MADYKAGAENIQDELRASHWVIKEGNAKQSKKKYTHTIIVYVKGTQKPTERTPSV